MKNITQLIDDISEIIRHLKPWAITKTASGEKIFNNNNKYHVFLLQRALRLKQLLVELETLMLTKDCNESDFIGQYLNLLKQTPSPLASDKENSTSTQALLNAEEEINEIYNHLLAALSNIFIKLYITALLKKAETLYKDRLQNKKYTMPVENTEALWGIFRKEIEDLLEQAKKELPFEEFLLKALRQELEKNSDLKQSISSTASFRTSNGTVDQFLKDSLKKTFELFNNFPFKMFIKKQLIKPLIRHINLYHLTQDSTAALLKLHDQTHEPLIHLMGPSCVASVFEWGKRIKIHPSTEPSILLSNYLNFISELKENQFPTQLPLMYLYQGDRILTPEIFFYNAYINAFLNVCGRSLVYENSCSGQLVAKRTMEAFEKNAKTLSSLAPKVSVVEVTLNPPEKDGIPDYLPHVIGIAQIQGKNKNILFALMDSENATMLFAPKQFAEKLQQHFESLKLNKTYKSFSLRIIDRALDALIGLECLRTQTPITPSQLSALKLLVAENYPLTSEIQALYQNLLAPEMRISESLLTTESSAPAQSKTQPVPSPLQFTPGLTLKLKAPTSPSKAKVKATESKDAKSLKSSVKTVKL